MTSPLDELVRDFGRETAAKYATGAGEPEEHLRGPVEDLVRSYGEAHLNRKVVLAGEERLPGLHVKPDFAAHVDGTLVGFVEIKAPGKGADPERFREEHDKRQWERLRSLPNLVYTDGNRWARYSYGERQGSLVELDGDVESAGEQLSVDGEGLARLFTTFLTWEPHPPRSARELALISARLCRLLRAEILELLATDSGLQALARDWRQMLFPEASDDEFTDGYAQTVTFALLLARVEDIDFADGDLGRIADQLADRHTLIGTALDVLTNPRVLDQLAGTLDVLVRVLSVVDWETVTGGDATAWLLFYEDFLAEYDPKLRRQTGSYYTPNEVVDAMVRLVDDLLRDRLDRHYGLAGRDVTLVDPAAGTGTFGYRIIERIARTIAEEEGAPEVPAKLRQSASRLIGFELQTGPYAVAEFRLSEAYRRLGAPLEPGSLRLHLTNTLADPYVEEGRLAAVYEPIAVSRRQANEIKRRERVLVVASNPPYRERSHGEGGWVEHGRPDQGEPPILNDFIPPPDWGLGAHVKHIYNPYVYFWRWALWKVFEHQPEEAPEEESVRGVVALITVAGFLNGPGFAAMRRHMRATADAIWVIDLSPEGHQPPVNTRVFAGVQQPICITIALRDGTTGTDEPAPVRHVTIGGLREEKFARLGELTFDDASWRDCPDGWRTPFLPAPSESWTAMPAIDDLLPWSGSGTMPGRTWPVGPDPETLRHRWESLIEASVDRKPELLSEHPRDRTVHKVLRDGLPGHAPAGRSIAEESGPCPEPVRIAYRSFDRQWIIPDKRLINQPNPSLWWTRSEQQIYLTGLTRHSPTAGPAVSVCALVPDLHHYKGSFGGRVFPLWRDPDGSSPNVTPGLLDHLAAAYGRDVEPEDLFAYVVALTAHAGYTERFREELTVPGLRLPLTADAATFSDAADIGRHVIWLHTFGQRCVDPSSGRPSRPPQLPDERRPKVTRAIPTSPGAVPETIDYDEASRELLVGDGAIAPVEPEVWAYEVSGMRVLRHWFGYRQRHPEGRRSSPLDDIVHEAWDSAWTTELLEIINVIQRLIDLEPEQNELLDRVTTGEMITVGTLEADGVLPPPRQASQPPRVPAASQPTLDEQDG